MVYGTIYGKTLYGTLKGVLSIWCTLYYGTIYYRALLALFTEGPFKGALTMCMALLIIEHYQYGAIFCKAVCVSSYFL